MEQDKDQKWQKNNHSTFVSTKLRSFFHISRPFAEEKTAFTEYPHFLAIFGLIIGYSVDAYTKIH